MKPKMGRVKPRITQVAFFRVLQRGGFLHPRVGVRGSEASLHRREL